jgi:hypothetical protein
MRIVICLCLLALSAALFAQEAKEAEATENVLLFDYLDSTPAVRLPQGYQFQLSFQISPSDTVATYIAWLEFRTVSDKVIACRYLDQASKGLYQIVDSLSIQTGAEAQTINKRVLLPATWYRGEGILSLAIRPCKQETNAQSVCPNYDDQAKDMLRLEKPFILP